MTRGVKRLKTDHHHPNNIPCLPHELVLDNILNRLPGKTLIRWSCVSKLWHNSIHKDPHFVSSHFLHSQKNSRLIFSFLNVKDRPEKLNNYFFCLKDDKEEEHEGNDVDFLRLLSKLEGHYERNFIGICNGLVCLLQRRYGMIEILNPCRDEILSILLPIFNGTYACYGFGFDSLTKEFKIVIVYHSKCLVFTLGSNLWRETTTSPPPNFHPINPYNISCGGTLFWRIRSNGEPDKGMLLSFDLQSETFQVIQLPDELASMWANYRCLLEYKGSLCVARIEKLIHRFYRISWKVHLHFLRDKVKQEWIKETFDIPSCFSRNNFSHVSFTGIVSSEADRVLLSRYNGEGLHLYDLQTKHLNKEVKPCCPDGYLIFRQENITNTILLHQLNSYTENFLSLQTFLPEGACRLLDDKDALRGAYSNAFKARFKQAKTTSGGVLCISRKPILG